MKVKEVYLFQSVAETRTGDPTSMVSLQPWTYKEINISDEATESNPITQTYDGVVLNDYINSFYSTYQEEQADMYSQGTYTGTYTKGDNTWSAPVINVKTSAREIRVYGNTTDSYGVLYPRLGIGYIYVYAWGYFYECLVRVQQVSGGITYSQWNSSHNLNSQQIQFSEYFLNKINCTYNFVAMG